MWEGEGRRGGSGLDLQSGHGQTLCWERKCSLIPQLSHRLLWLTRKRCSMLSRGQFCDTNEKYFGNSCHGEEDTFEIIAI